MRRLTGIFVVLASFYSGWLWMDYRAFPARQVANAQTVVIEIARGRGLKAIAEQLEQAGVLDRRLWFTLYAYVQGVAGKLKAGEYEIPAGLGQTQVLDMLVAGRVKQYPLTVPEGWRFAQMLEAMDRQTALLQNVREKSGKDLMTLLGMPDHVPEGWFYPDTYFYHKGMAALELLRLAQRKMQTILAQEWQGRAPELPLASPYEALILASIVEKETGLAEERPKIAGVFLRRLARNMPLQTDPTVIYGMGDAYRGNLRKEDLMRDTPYNTYVHHGLPPTPIALPGQQAIRATLHPEPGESLYFVARGDGGHVFSDTLDQHNRAVELYQRHQP
ncbi:endolytic transglycosylase MltG [Methylococcus sp. EFPC2]|uniref:endolytic transglycosylase MltG n=1 Tax=Methylococcus sp. EFPC2 TaxID=2812648 RepID=UPI0019677878|nr:endolytic transglycosylase MltG [Methylococcus sp. EFPC2]QSA97396.1 endolytic transglycosylase MltG [Methylococcus sp. EFPC2]